MNQMTATNATKSPNTKSTAKPAINSIQAKTITKPAVASPHHARPRSAAEDTSQDLVKHQTTTPAASDNGRTNQVDHLPDDHSHDTSSDSDGYASIDLSEESADDSLINTRSRTRDEIEQVHSKFIQKYSKSCSQKKVLQNWRAFDKERGRRMAKVALKHLKSGFDSGSFAWTRKKGGYYVGTKNGFFGNSYGTRDFWPGRLPEARLENIKQEFIKWMKVFGWEVDEVTLNLEDDKLVFDWEIEVPEN